MKNEAPTEAVVKICHKYIFEGEQLQLQMQMRSDSEEEMSLKKEENILDKEVIMMKQKLQKAKAEMDLQQSIWKKVLHDSKEAIRNYRGLNLEIVNIQQITNLLMTMIDKNTEDWRQLYLIKNNGIDELKRYKFFIAAILESCSQELRGDIQQFDFGHDEDDRQIYDVMGQKKEFDIYDYLNQAYTSNKEVYKTESNGLLLENNLDFDKIEGQDEEPESGPERDGSESGEYDPENMAKNIGEFKINYKKSDKKQKKPRKTKN